MSDNKIRVIAYTNPVRPEYRDTFFVPEGTTVDDAIHSTPTLGKPIAILNSNVVTDYTIKLKKDDIFAVRFVPEGNGAEVAQKTGAFGVGLSVLGFGLMMLFPPLALVGAAMAVGGVFTGLTGAVVGALYGQNKTSTVYSLTEGSNPEAKGKGVPLILGSTRTTPLRLCYATRISGTDGEDKEILLQYIVGAGPLEISNIRLGDTLLSANSSNILNGLITDIQHFQGVTLEVRQGGSQPTLFPYVIHEDAPNVVLYGGEENVRETSVRTTRISVDIGCNGLYKNNNGSKGTVTVVIEARYRKKDSLTTWANAPLLGYFNGSNNSIARNKTNIMRFNVAKDIASWDAEYATDGVYEVMVKRITADSTDTKVIDKFSWDVIRSINVNEKVVEQDELDNYNPVLLGLAIKANDTISGSINTLSCIASAKIPVWDGVGSGPTHWLTPAISSNPAAVMLNLLRCSNNPEPAADDDIYWPAIETLYSYCATKGFTCKGTVNDSQDLESLLIEVCATGRAIFTRRDEKYSVVIDNEKTNVTQLFGPHNTKNFSWSQEYPDRPQAYIIKFRDENNRFQEDERVVFDDGYDDTNAERYETISLKYNCNSDNVWKQGRYLIACSRLRPARYQFEAPDEAVVCEPGDLIGIVHDTPMFGIADARVKTVAVDGSGNTTAFTVNNKFRMETGKEYQISIISRNRILYTKDIITVAGSQEVITLNGSIPAGDPIYEDDHVYFGLKGSTYVRQIVTGKVHTKDRTFIIYTIDEAPAVHTADTGTIPVWTPQIGTARGIDPSTDIPTPVNRGADGADPFATLYQYSIDGSTNWHSVWVTGDNYVRQSTDNGTTWGDVIKFVGPDGDTIIGSISGGLFSITWNALGVNPAPVSSPEFSAGLSVNGVVPSSGITYAWQAYGNLSGTGTNSTFTPIISNPGNNDVSSTGIVCDITYQGKTVREVRTISVAKSPAGVAWVADWDGQAVKTTISGGHPYIMAGGIYAGTTEVDPNNPGFYRVAQGVFMGKGAVNGITGDFFGLIAVNAGVVTFKLNGRDGSAWFGGTLEAPTGNIGGFTLASDSLYAGSGVTRVQMKAGEGIWLGADALANAPFSVTKAGALKASNATIDGLATLKGLAISGFTAGDTYTIKSADTAVICTQYTGPKNQSFQICGSGTVRIYVERYKSGTGTPRLNVLLNGSVIYTEVVSASSYTPLTLDQYVTAGSIITVQQTQVTPYGNNILYVQNFRIKTKENLAILTYLGVSSDSNITVNANLNITQDEETDATRYILFADSYAGAQVLKAESNLRYNPLSGLISLGALTTSGDVIVGGNLTVNGTVTTINSTELTVDDKNIELGSVASPTDATANGGGITLKGATDKTIIWDSVNGNWTLNQNVNIPTGLAYKINNVSVLNATTLGSSVVGSSLTSVGQLSSLNMAGNIVPVSDNSYDIGSGSFYFKAAYINDPYVKTLHTLGVYNVSYGYTIDSQTSVGLKIVSEKSGATPLSIDGDGNISTGWITGKGISLGNTGIDYIPSGLGGGNIILNGLNYTSIVFHDSGSTIGNIKFSGTNGFEIGASDGTYGPHNTLVHGNLSLATGKEYKINGTSVLSATTLGSGVTGSSLTSVGTLTGLTVSGGIVGRIGASAAGTNAVPIWDNLLADNLADGYVAKIQVGNSFQSSHGVSMKFVLNTSSGSYTPFDALTLLYNGNVLLGTITTGVWNASAITDTYLATISTAGKVANSATTATSENIASAIVARDTGGNFAASNIYLYGASNPYLRIDKTDATAHTWYIQAYQDAIGIGTEWAKSLRVYSNGTIQTTGVIEIGTEIYARGSFSILNKADNDWITFATRDTSGAEAVYNLANVGSISATYLKIADASNTYIFARFLGGVAVNNTKYSGVGIGSAEITTGKTGVFGYYTDNDDLTKSGIYLANYGDSEVSQSIFLKRGGNVGIGTTEPFSGYKLDVRGNVIIGTQWANSTLTIAGQSGFGGVLSTQGETFCIDNSRSGDMIFWNKLYLASTGALTPGTFQSGSLGTGWKLDYNATVASKSYLEIDNIRVRDTLFASVFQKDIIRVSNGQFYFTDGGIIAAIDGTYVYFDPDKSATFSSGQRLEVKDIAIATGIGITSVKLDLTSGPTTVDGLARYTYTLVSGAIADIAVGSTAARISGGNLLADAVTANSPFLDVRYDYLTKARLGNLSGITSPNLGTLSGWGLWSDNIYLEGNANIIGTLAVGGGSTVGNTFYVGKVRKNYIINSEYYSGWTANGSSGTSNVVTDTPMGTGNVISMNTDNGWGPYRVDEVYTAGQSGDVTLSCWARQKSGSAQRLAAFIYDDGDHLTHGTEYTLTSSWVRYSWTWTNRTFTNPATSLHRGFGLFGTSGAVIEIWGAQFEFSSTATPYQKTDATLSSSTGYGMWATAGGFGGTMQNPVVALGDYGMKVLGVGTAAALSASSIMIGNITGSNNFAIKLTNTGSSDTSGLFGYDNVGLIFKLALDGTASIASWKFDSTKIYSSGLSGGGDGSYTTAGMLLGSTGYISAPNFCVTSAGNIYAKGGAIASWNLSANRLYANWTQNVGGGYVSMNTANQGNSYGNGMYGRGFNVTYDTGYDAGMLMMGELPVSYNADGAKWNFAATDATRKIGIAHYKYNSPDPYFEMSIVGQNTRKNIIAGWNFNTYKLYNDSVGLQVGSGTDWAFWAGATDIAGSAAKVVFRHDGSGYLANNNIYWDTTGNLVTTGEVRATSGYLGDGTNGWTIGANGITGHGTSIIQTVATANTGIKLDASSLRLYNGSAQTGELAVDGSGWFGLTGARAISWTTAGVVTIGGWTASASALSTGAFDTVDKMYFGSSGLSLSNVFKVTAAGALTAKSGTVAGFTIDATEGLYAGETTAHVQMKPAAGIWAGATALADAPFSVTNAGALKATSGTVGGWIIDSGVLKSDNFTVDVSGFASAGCSLNGSTGLVNAYGAKFVSATIKNAYLSGGSFVNVEAGANLFFSLPSFYTERQVTYTSYFSALFLSYGSSSGCILTMPASGTIRVRFTIRTDVTNPGTCYGKVYKKTPGGSWTAIGAEHSTTSTTGESFYDDIPVSEGDQIQLYMKISASGRYGYCSALSCGMSGEPGLIKYLNIMR